MSLRGLSAALFIVPVLLAVLALAGCGGGEQSGNGGGGSRDGKVSDAKGEQQGAGAADKDRPKAKVALGTIVAADPESKPHGKIILRPTAEVQGGERMIFKPGKNTEITLDGKEVQLADIKKGQQAQITYVALRMVNKKTDKTREVNRARVVQVFSEGERNRGG